MIIFGLLYLVGKTIYAILVILLNSIIKCFLKLQRLILIIVAKIMDKEIEFDDIKKVDEIDDDDHCCHSSDESFDSSFNSSS